MKLSIFVLCLVLVAAVAGKYKAEAAVRSAAHDIERLKSEREAVVRDIQLLRAEVAYLESPERLSMIATSVTNLKPLSGRQLMTADDFLASITNGDVSPARNDESPRPVIATTARAVAMADLQIGAR